MDYRAEIRVFEDDGFDYANRDDFESSSIAEVVKKAMIYCFTTLADEQDLVVNIFYGGRCVKHIKLTQ